MFFTVKKNVLCFKAPHSVSKKGPNSPKVCQKCTRDFINGIGKRVGNEFFIRLNRLDYAFTNAFANSFANAFDHGFAHAFLDVLNGAVFDVVF
jgi:hypothetical protein